MRGITTLVVAGAVMLAGAGLSSAGAAAASTRMAGSPPAARLLDVGRAAARVNLKARSAKPAAVHDLATLSSGTMAAGATKQLVWNNANQVNVYQVLLSPLPPSTGSGICRFSVDRTWYGRKSSGARQFYFEFTNQSAFPCSTDILLRSVDPSKSWSGGNVPSGGSRSWALDNIADGTVYLPGVRPAVSDSGEQCRFQVVRTGYTQQPSGTREFSFTVKNIGAVACANDLEMATLSGITPASPNPIQPQVTGSLSYPFNATQRFLTGLLLVNDSSTAPCSFDLSLSSYDSIDAFGYQLMHVPLTNTGSVACRGTVMLAPIGA